MSLTTIRLIKCDGFKCHRSAEVDGSTRKSRSVLRRQNGWVRVRRGQSMADLCPEHKPKAQAPGGKKP